ncbi:ATP-binding cassette domain-containing protein [Smaragdicoccus niigatensis]|uniref:ATP-binding cassette domain-containing protein n=1 Tax=Smaragdicoccus niigatensis TaxID=359359 RepID=UPI000AFBAD1B|nr:ATP-binding cassette domain-containing protein [Smaragdicoccus niigatensis]
MATKVPEEPSSEPTMAVQAPMMKAPFNVAPPHHAGHHAPVPAGGAVRTLGRASDNDIQVPDMLVSRHHARLFRSTEGLIIEDLSSANGTFINGQRSKRSTVHEGDVVTVGNTDFVAKGNTLVARDKIVQETGLALYDVGFAVGKSKYLLSGVSFAAPPGTLTAIIGPSGAGKSTLAKLIAGSTSPTDGAVTFDGHNLHHEYEALRNRLGMVPQDDVLHRQLTVRQALSYAAELRLPPDTTPEDRDRVVAQVLEELSLTNHLDTRVDSLSGGQRKRASVALELLTSPSLLILDEPTSGLDPALDRQVMTMLRELADHGRVVLVITHSLTYLDMCDKVLLLAPGGKTAYCGRPSGVNEVNGSSDWAEIFATVTDDPNGVAERYIARHPKAAAPPLEPPPSPAKPVLPKISHQVSTLTRRQLRLILADRGYLAFLVVMPFILGALTLIVPGEDGFKLGPESSPDEPRSILVLLILGACFMGTTLTARDLVGERSIYHRERAVGLRPSAYLLAKTVVFCAAAIAQSAVLMGITLAAKPGPGKGAFFSSGALELSIDIALTACCCVMVGLFLSTLARTADQVMPLLVVSIMGQLVMSAGLIEINARLGLNQLSWLFPSRWGFAAGAVTIDLRSWGIGIEADTLWQHNSAHWLLATEMLVLLGVVFALLTFRRLEWRAAVQRKP